MQKERCRRMEWLRRWFGVVAALALLSCVGRQTAGVETRATETTLAALAVDPAPWLHMEAYSEQRQPIYLGATPREMELGLAPVDQGRPLLPKFLKPLGWRQAIQVRDALLAAGKAKPGDAVEFEAWPVRDDTGRLTWTFARYRAAGQAPWRWLDAALLAAPNDQLPDDAAIPPKLPAALDPADPKEFGLIFNDFTELEGLYDKPAFGDCVWTSRDEAAPLATMSDSRTAAWLPTERREALRRERKAPAALCRVTPPPARLNGKPTTWILKLSGATLTWPQDIGWKENWELLPQKHQAYNFVHSWPHDFTKKYKQDLLALDGERKARFPVSKRTVRFTAKSGADPNNQLGLFVAYLEERYKVLGLETRRQDFTWRGLPQANLVAVIPGSLPRAQNRPVLMADHIDTAYCEDVYLSTRQRVAAPGADDNVSATAALLRAAEMLKDSRPLHDIWLVHLTGEEFPPDDLGAREFLPRLLREKRDIGGLVLMDLIGWRAPGDKIFQVNPGDNQASMELAALAFAAARDLDTGFTPVLRPRFDPRSYLYNTDGLLFSDVGYPVILFNEHMNRLENLNRVGYHHSTDNSRKIDFEYAAAVAKIAIATTSWLAHAPGRAAN